MKISLSAAQATLAIALTLTITTMALGQVNLAKLISVGGTFQNGDKLFSDFRYYPMGDMPSAQQIDVLPFSDIFGNLGIRFVGPFVDLPGSGPSDAVLEYKVTATDRSQRIHDVYLAANAKVVGGPGFATVTETFLPQEPTLSLSVYDLQPGGQRLTDWAYLTRPRLTVHVQKGIMLYAASRDSLATISFIDQSFSQIPEPAAMMTSILGIALISFRSQMGSTRS